MKSEASRVYHFGFLNLLINFSPIKGLETVVLGGLEFDDEHLGILIGVSAIITLLFLLSFISEWLGNWLFLTSEGSRLAQAAKASGADTRRHESNTFRERHYQIVTYYQSAVFWINSLLPVVLGSFCIYFSYDRIIEIIKLFFS